MKGKIAEMEETFELMKKKEVSPNFITYVAMLESYGRWNYWAKAKEISEYLVKKESIEGSRKVYNTILDIFAKKGDFTQMRNAWDQMIRLGIEPTLETYNIILSSLQGDTQQMKDTYEDMIRRGTKPDIVTMGLLLNSYSIHGNIERMENIYQNIKEMGFKPNELIFNHLLLGYGRAGKLDENLKNILREMENHSVPLTPTHISSIMTSHSDDLEKLQKIYDQYRKEHRYPSLQGFELLINTLGNAGKMDKMYQIFLESQMVLGESNIALVQAMLNHLDKDRTGKWDSIRKSVSELAHEIELQNQAETTKNVILSL